MTIVKIFLFFALISFSVACGYLLGQQTNVAVIAQKSPAKATKNFDLLSKIKEEKIKEIKVWSDFYGDDEDKYYVVIRKIAEQSEALTIYDKSGKSLYVTQDSEINNIQSARFMKPDSWQVMFETNSGGTDDFLKILDLRNGKFSEVIDPSETQLRGGYFTMLQYGKNQKTPYGQPSQLIVIQQLGGADENPTASIFRTKDNKFQKVGEIRMQELGDFIEKQIAQK